MHNAIKEKAHYFAERLGQLIKDRGYSHTRLAKEMNDKYQTGYTHNDVANWLKSGQLPEKRYKDPDRVHIPKFDTLVLIADFFGVDVGFLLGETDGTRFEMGKAMGFTGLNEDALNNIRSITKDESACFHKLFCMPFEAIPVLNKLFSSEALFSLLRSFVDIDGFYNAPDEEKKLWQTLESELGKDLLDEAVAFDKQYCEGDPLPRQELIDAINKMNKTIDDCYGISQSKEYSCKVHRYDLQRSFEIFAEYLYPLDRKR